MVHKPPLDRWKANPTSRDQWDYALYPRNAAPRPTGLDADDLEALIEEYEQVNVNASEGRLRVHVRLKGGGDGQ